MATMWGIKQAILGKSGWYGSVQKKVKGGFSSSGGWLQFFGP
jgi:hypothetical protein